MSILLTQKARIFDSLSSRSTSGQQEKHHTRNLQHRSHGTMDICVKRMCMEKACTQLPRPLSSMIYRILKTSENPWLHSRTVRGQKRGARPEDGFFSPAPTRLLLSRVNKPTPTKQHTRPENTMTSRPDVNESTEITSPPQRRTGARRGPRVSNACVNCRRRKVCGGAGFPFCETCH